MQAVKRPALDWETRLAKTEALSKRQEHLQRHRDVLNAQDVTALVQEWATDFRRARLRHSPESFTAMVQVRLAAAECIAADLSQERG